MGTALAKWRHGVKTKVMSHLCWSSGDELTSCETQFFWVELHASSRLSPCFNVFLDHGGTLILIIRLPPLIWRGGGEITTRTCWEIQRAEIISCGIGHICKWQPGNSHRGNTDTTLTSLVKWASAGFLSVPDWLYSWRRTKCMLSTQYTAILPAASSASSSISMRVWAELHAASQTPRMSQWEEAPHATDRRRRRRRQEVSLCAEVRKTALCSQRQRGDGENKKEQDVNRPQVFTTRKGCWCTHNKTTSVRGGYSLSATREISRLRMSWEKRPP